MQSTIDFISTDTRRSFFIMTVPMMIAMTLPWTLAWLQTPPETMRMAHDFLAIYLIDYVADFLYRYFAAVLRSHGNTTLPAIVILLSTVMNTLLSGGISVLVGSILLVMFARQLSGLFVDARPVADVVSIYFIIIGLGYVFNTLTNCLIGALNGMGRPTRGMLLMLFYYLLVRVPLSFLLSAATGSVSGVCVAVLISHVVAFASAAGVYLLSGGRTPEPARAGRG
ncbi:multi antimicrobial extrusion protein MatE [Coriobacterium glomerans PW2]|uniref:Multi antimicrobial extrusion protein MatE n=1 Tax=Coriobacterium glomerans (strain ATCC 49209 / DSM 20642 / JCM 10262 / PW2) TaxID=700015 RepID=F2N8C7_CORGP|nr:MATE family efflux transporter [Coriobacterium glomerans]AEB07310.1 multi antimicrobial extrusion protein MatE [Coriobacterium glomerans PW2]